MELHMELRQQEPPVGPLVHEEISSRLTDVMNDWLDLLRSNERNHVEKLLATDSNALLSSLDLAVVLSAVKPDSDITDRDHVIGVDDLCVAGLSGSAGSQRPLMDSNHRPTA